MRIQVKVACMALCAAVAGGAIAQEPARRLSAWLLENTRGDSYLAGTSWLAPEEEPAQRSLKDELLRELDARGVPAALRDWLASLPVTGRVPVIFADPRWLAAHPERDPVLLRGHRVILPRRPASVTVVGDDGRLCPVAHESGRHASAYVRACSTAPADWAWIVQPDGRVERYGVASWNGEAQDEPAPGAWIWAPARSSAYPDRLSEQLARFLATQGPAPDPAGALLQPEQAARSSSQGITLHGNDFGETGLMQTPSARIPPAGTLRVNATHVWPYSRINVTASPFDWLEAGFRYTDITNRDYGITTQTYKDKSFDAKLRLWRESAYVPTIAAGIRDMGGTGLFSSEYLVASKRFGPFDATAGIAWGYAAGAGRPNEHDPNGGNFNYHSYFRGRRALFGGLQYQTPWPRLTLMVEREANRYQHEPLGSTLPQRTPWNFGLTYGLTRSMRLTAGLERGNRLLVGLAVEENVAQMYVPKISDPRLLAYSPPPEREPDWQATANELARQTGWRIGRIERSGRELRVSVLDARTIYWTEREERGAAVLNRDAPAGIERFVFVQVQGGTEMAEHVVDRRAWAVERTRPATPQEKTAIVTARAPQPPAQAAEVFAPARRRLEHAFGPDFQYTFGGPDAFVLYSIGVAERARMWIRDDTWLRGSVRLGLVDNYDRFQYTAASDLPRVRTFAREYVTTSRATMPNLQATHAGRVGQNQFYSVYAGYLEEIFGGVGTEWLYRPLGSRFAAGVDVNYVRQRNFDQHFAFMDYGVGTGHATLYADTGWNDVLVTASAGRYLAGDWGGTLQLSRVFRNGITMGAFATRTNAGARFGEGSFDKGIVLTIPLDAIFTRSTEGVAQMTWRPLLRDGGAKLSRQDALYPMTSVRDGRTLWFRPAAKSNDFSIAPPAR